jgi:hypothetical protein
VPRESLDTPENLSKEAPRQVALGQLEHEGPRMPDQPPAGLEEPLLETRQGPALDADGQDEPTHQIAEVVGPEAFRTLLDDYWSKTPPQMYAALEADAFASYLEALDLRVPHLAKLLELERATIATLTDGQVRVVQFDFEPLPLLRALAEGRLPDQAGRAGNYEVELTPDGPASTTGLDLEAVQREFPFH